MIEQAPRGIVPVAAKRPRARWRLDAIVALALAIAAYAAATRYARHAVASGTKPQFYQVHYGPAAMWACGYGYVSPQPGTIPSLDDFLAQRRDTFACADIRSAPTPGRLTGPQATWRYLLLAAGLVWRVNGVSWPGLWPLVGLMCAATTALCYLLVRLVAGPVAAATAAVLVVSSPLHLAQLPELRDYSKTPFMMGAWLVLAALAARSPTPRRVLGLSALFGVIVGIGSGFRNDMLIVMPALLIVLVLLPGRLWAHVPLKIAAAIVAVAAFYVSARPLLGAYTEGGGASMQHVTLLGLTTPFTEQLGLDQPIYELARLYDDSLAGAIVGDYAVRRDRIDQPMLTYSGAYDAAANHVIAAVFRTFPADLLARGGASIVKIARLPASSYEDSQPPRYVSEDGWIGSFYSRRLAIVHRMWWMWPLVVPAALLVGAARNPRAAAVALLLVVYFASYPAIQFGMRHFFHLNVMSWMALAFLAGMGWTTAKRFSRGDAPAASDWSRAARRVAAFALVTAVLTAVPLYAAGRYQDWRLRGEIESRLAAPSERVRLEPRDAGEGRILLEAAALPAEVLSRERVGTVRSEYLVADFSGASCDAFSTTATVLYRSRGDYLGFTHTIDVVLPEQADQLTRVLIPVFYRSASGPATITPDEQFAYGFVGLVLPERDAPCLAGLSRLTDTARFDLLFAATLTPEWRSGLLHQRLAIVRPDPAREPVHVVTSPTGLRAPRQVVRAAVEWPDVDVRNVRVSRTDGGWTMNDRTAERFGYLLYFKPIAAGAGARAVVEGVLYEGGISIGIVRDDRWLTQTSIVSPGRFVVVLGVDAPGPASLVVASALSTSLKNHFDLVRGGWIAPGSGGDR